MNTENLTKEERLIFFRDLYESAKDRYADTLEAFDRNMRQYRGDDEIDGATERATTVRNITYEIVESQISSDIPLPKVDAACFSEKRERNARSVERLCTAIRDTLSYEEMNDLDERYTYIYGGSVWYVEWDQGRGRDGSPGGVRLHCLSPRDFIPQPNLTAVDDMEYFFLRFTTTRAELCRRYGATEEESFLAECEFSEEGTTPDEDTVTLIVAFYRDGDGEIGQFIFSGDLALSDLPRYYHRQLRVCRRCGKIAELCDCEKPSFVTRGVEEEILTANVRMSDGTVIPSHSPVIEDGCPVPCEEIGYGDYKMEKTRLPYYVPRSFPIVIRKNTSTEGRLFGQSDCDVIRPQQQAINKVESRILQKLLRAGITPIMPEDATVALNNAVFGQVIRLKPGENAAQYGKVDTTPNIAQDIAEAERLYDQAKRTVGISDAYQGIDSATNESGVARQLRISQASGRLESKRKMKHTAYADMDRLIFEHYLAFADEPRRLNYKDAYGRTHDAEFNRYDFLYYDPTAGKYRVDDEYLFSVDLNGGAEYQREALWERNLANLRAGTLGDPTATITLLRYWQCQERAHYPFARENVEYFLAAVDKENAAGIRKGENEWQPQP